jgi:hypothetical protein
MNEYVMVGIMMEGREEEERGCGIFSLLSRNGNRQLRSLSCLSACPTLSIIEPTGRFV